MVWVTDRNAVALCRWHLTFVEGVGQISQAKAQPGPAFTATISWNHWFTPVWLTLIINCPLSTFFVLT
jgi:hypothetical protein